MTSLFTFRATKPIDMKRALDPIGSENDKWLIKSANDASVAVGVWGDDGGYRGRAKLVIALLSDMSYI